MITRLSLFALMLAFVSGAHAEVKLPALISDHMVLQQKQSNPIWGWDTPGISCWSGLPHELQIHRNHQMNTTINQIIVGALALIATAATAAEFHVSGNGNDMGDGSSARPFKTISAAAKVAQPGDAITVHEGVYRERVNPPRGGESDAKRISYQAAPGEKVEIKGSEIVKGWVKVQDDVWKVTLPNSFFGNFNPYSDVLRGDWFYSKGREHHTGAVYLNGDWLTEAAGLGEVLKPTGTNALWFGNVSSENTTIWAQFKGVDPNQELVEINVRRAVFYPDKPGRNYITVRGFTMRHAATPWAPPTAEQIGLIGTHWSKGWIIESNTISHSVCSGVSLGKYGDEFDNTSADTAEGYVKTIELALQNGWNRETIGHHLVRDNTISHCEQAGIVGSLGCSFSRVTGNTIHDIHVRQLFNGAEMAGIKFHGAIDTEISHNHIYRTFRGLWLDWMAQGTRVSGNLLHDNFTQDLYAEVNHGPFLVDNNLFLSAISLRDWSEGGAYVNNLLTGQITTGHPQTRQTPYHPSHTTALASLVNVKGADDRFYNNIFIGDGKPAVATTSTNKPATKGPPLTAGFGLWVYDSDEFPLHTSGNVYFNGARPYTNESNPLVLSGIDPKVKVVVEGGQTFIQFNFGSELKPAATMLRQFGNHPSFVMLALGNELGGKKEIFTRLITEWQKDHRRVYSIKANSTANPPEVDYEVQLELGGDRLRYQQHWTPQPTGTVFHTRPPQTELDWRAGVSRSAKPLRVHESGQFCAFPDVVNGAAGFTGYLKPASLDIVCDGLRERGMLPQAKDFVRASGEWQKRLYREEIESHLRTPGLAGFDLLQLNDFTGQDTAPVGLCDAFYEPKSYVKPAEFRRFNAPTVPLARMSQRVWTDDQNFTADIELSHFGPQDRLRLTNLTATMRNARGKILFQQTLPAAEFTRTNCQFAGRVTTSLTNFVAPAKYFLEVAMPDGSLRNDWEFWVFPSATPPEPTNVVHIVSAFDDATRDLLNRGCSVLLLPKLDNIRGGLPIAFTTLYWKQFGLVGGQSSGNGILLDPKHPAFADFPTEFHSNWHWWELLTRCRPMILDAPDAQQPWPKTHRPLAQLIDGWKTNRKLALLVEARMGSGRLAICSMDLDTDLGNRPVARQFRHSLMSYLNSPAFNPKNEVTAGQIAAVFRNERSVGVK